MDPSTSYMNKGFSVGIWKLISLAQIIILSKNEYFHRDQRLKNLPVTIFTSFGALLKFGLTMTDHQPDGSPPYPDGLSHSRPYDKTWNLRY